MSTTPETATAERRTAPAHLSERVAFVNAKGGMRNTGARDGNGHLLAPSDDRITEATRFWNKIGASIAGYCEFNSHQAARIEGQHKRWRLHHATPNKRTKTSWIGNGIAWRRKVWRLVTTDEIVVEDTVSNYVPKVITLHLPVVRLRHRQTGEEVIVIAVHFPAGNRPAIWREKRRCSQAVLDYARGQSVPVVVIGDLNARKGLRLIGWQGFMSTVDHLRVKGRARLIQPQVHPALHRLVTDHHGGLSAVLSTGVA